jgi:hypothetical protein
MMEEEEELPWWTEKEKEQLSQELRFLKQPLEHNSIYRMEPGGALTIVRTYKSNI